VVVLPNLSPAVIAGLKDKYAEAMRRDDVKAIVLTGQISRLSSSLFNLVFYHH
jgi:enoyl-CoA hydratase/carnithine racemase